VTPFNATLMSIGVECCTFGVALFYYSKMKSRYLPLLILLGIGVCNDLFSIGLVYAGKSNSINANIYVLFDLLIIVWFFKKLSKTKRNYFLAIVAAIGICLWILDNLILHFVNCNNSLYRMGASAFIVLMTLERLGDITIFNGPDRILKTDVLILIGLLVCYCCKTFTECFHVFHLKVDKSFYVFLWMLMAIIRIITYILFSLAILWAPKKTEYISHL
jgi:hypothetical protein